MLSDGSPAEARRRRIPRCVWMAIPLFAMVVMLGLVQRALMYFPDRRDAIRPSDAGLPPGQVHAVTVRTPDGLTLNGWHVLPNGRSADDQAECDRELAGDDLVILYFSGNAGNRMYRVRHCLNATAANAHVFLFDYRGYGDNSGKPTEANLHADAHAVWNYVTRDRSVDPKRVVLYGESLGGGVATRLAAELCEAGTAPGGLFLCAAFSSMVDTAAVHYSFLPIRLVLVDRYPAADYMARVTCPVYHVHGTDDRIVPIALGRKLIAAAPERSASGVPKTFAALPDVGHNDIPHTILQTHLRHFFSAVEQTRNSSER